MCEYLGRLYKIIQRPCLRHLHPESIFKNHANYGMAWLQRTTFLEMKEHVTRWETVFFWPTWLEPIRSLPVGNATFVSDASVAHAFRVRKKNSLQSTATVSSAGGCTSLELACAIIHNTCIIHLLIHQLLTTIEEEHISHWTRLIFINAIQDGAQSAHDDIPEFPPTGNGNDCMPLADEERHSLTQTGNGSGCKMPRWIPLPFHSLCIVLSASPVCSDIWGGQYLKYY